MAATAPAPRRARSDPARPARRSGRPAPPRRRPATRPRLLRREFAWIAIVAFLLAGIVALNVAALRLNLESQRLEERRERLASENAAASSELSRLAAAARIEAVARRKLGLVPPDETTYVRLEPPRR